MAKNKKEYREVVLNSKRSDYDVLADGCCSIKDLLAPASIKLNSETELMIENNYSRTYVLSGIQPQVHIGWLDPLFSPGFDVDTAIYIAKQIGYDWDPNDERVFQ